MTYISKLFPMVVLCYFLTVMKGDEYETYKFNIPKVLGFLLNPFDPKRLPLSVLLMHMSNLLSFCIGVAVYVIFDEFIFGKWYLGSLIVLILVTNIVMRIIERDWF